MDAIKGTFVGGQVRLNSPADWPDGLPVVVMPAAPSEFVDDGSDMSAEEIAARLALMDSFKPWTMTAEEEAEWQAARRAQKDFELAQFETRAKKLEKLFP